MLRIQRELIRCAPSLAQMLRSQETAPCTPPLERVHCRSWYDALHHGARAAITSGADVMNSSLAHVLRTLQDLIRCAQPRRMCCDRCRSWCDERQQWRTCSDYSRSCCDVLHHWSRRCGHCKSWCDVLHQQRRHCEQRGVLPEDQPARHRNTHKSLGTNEANTVTKTPAVGTKPSFTNAKK